MTTAVKTFDLSDKQLTIGDVFTPIKWGEYAVAQFGIYQKWLDGATVFDPTMGEGNLLEALINYGLSQGMPIEELPTQRLFGNELNTRYFENALAKFKAEYGLDMAANFSNEDFLKLPARTYDIIFGNPPWQNFVDLPASYKEQIKPYFFKYDLVGNSQSLLLGGSRIDIAALIIQVAIKDFLKPNGEAVIFMPFSLLLNDGANRSFRTYSIDKINYSLEKVFDFGNEDVFGGVATRYGLAHFVRDKKISFPIAYFRLETGSWREYAAKPIFHETDPLSIVEKTGLDGFSEISPITIKKESSPRQGINTCGANEIFFFDSCQELDENFVCLANKTSKEIILPKQFIFPLITSQEFKSSQRHPKKWVLLPYQKTGRPLDQKQVDSFPALSQYFNQNKEILENRKGVMLNATLSRGYWWALLGIGEYNFFSFKIVWEAYGKSTFNPMIFDGNWQANQSLQAFIPVRTKKEAERLLHKLQDKRIENYLLSLKMEGTMNWAQPGKIKKLLNFEE